jgi:hypothetical protein
MRILVAFIILICLGGVLAAAYGIGHVNYTSVQIAGIKTTCTRCHTVPVVRSADQVHNAHRNLACNVCHANGERFPPDPKTCVPCHSVPQYISVVNMHNAHYETDCITCHSATDNVQTSASSSGILRKIGIGVASFAVIGFIVNYVVARIRVGRKR